MRDSLTPTEVAMDDTDTINTLQTRMGALEVALRRIIAECQGDGDVAVIERIATEVLPDRR